VKFFTLAKENKKAQIAISLFVIALAAFFVALPFLVFRNLGPLHDLDYHLSTIRAMYLLWQEGQLGSRIYPNISGDVGYGSGLFYTRIPVFITVLFLRMGLSVSGAFFLLFFLLFFISGVVVFFFMRRVFGSVWLSLFLAIVYVFFPYALHNLYLRFGFAELFLHLALPLVAWGLYELFHRDNWKGFLPLFVSGYVLGIFTHITMMIIVTFLAVVYLALNWRKAYKWRYIIPLCVAGLLIVFVAAAVYIPVLVNMGVTLTYRMASAPRAMFEFSYIHIVGHVMSSVVILGTFFLFVFGYSKKKKEDRPKHHLHLLIVSAVILTLLIPALPLWFIAPHFIRMLQFPFRLQAIAAILVILMLGIVIKEYPFKDYFTKFAEGFRLMCFKRLMKSCVPFLLPIVMLICLVSMYATSLNIGGFRPVNTITNNVIWQSSHAGTGATSHGSRQFAGTDYHPTGAERADVERRHERLNPRRGDASSPIISSNVTVTKFANYQGLNQIAFMVFDPCEFCLRTRRPTCGRPHLDDNFYVVLYIPYEKFSDVTIYQFNMVAVNLSDGIRTENYNGFLKIRLAPNPRALVINPPAGRPNFGDSRVIISYPRGGALDTYLRENPFEFIIEENSTTRATNFDRNGVRYSIGFENVSELTRVELPTFFYRGYRLTFTSLAGEVQRLTPIHGSMGFIEVDIPSDGTLHVEFTGGTYLRVARIISWTGLGLMISTFSAVTIIYLIDKKRSRVIS